MAKIPNTSRRGARYSFRRRLSLPDGSTVLLRLPLATADPATARTRASALSARFEAIKARLRRSEGWRVSLTASQMTAVFKSELEVELGRAMAEICMAKNIDSAVLDSRLHHEAWSVTQAPHRPYELTPDDEYCLNQLGLDPDNIDWVRMLADRVCHPDAIHDADVEARLVELGYSLSPPALAVARMQMSRARAAARARASQFMDPLIQHAEDQAAAMLALPFDAATVSYVDWSSKPDGVPVPAAPAPASIFMARDERRFSEVIEDVVATMRHEGQWSGNASQQRRIMNTFTWITGNKRLCDYDHLDVDVFRRGLEQLPSSFRFGTSEKGAMSRPFAEAQAKLPVLTKEMKRTTNTTNRDLSTMSTVAKHLAKTAWRPTIPNTVVLDFAGATVKGSRRTEAAETRPPWTRPHLAVLFSSPLYTGGGGHLRRLRKGDEPKVFHDAAYFAPLMWYYTHACRDEICGLRVDEVDIEHAIRHIKIQDNDLRGRDGELAGEKRIARKRVLPLHGEILRLGFADYVRAIRAEGHVALFPELYGNAEKRGGAQFYNVAWRHMVELIGSQIALPKADNGKGPDIHSIRSLGSSFYEVEGVNEIMRADVMGHARTGTNAKHYSKRMATEGAAVVLLERKDFMERYIPVITGHLVPTAINLLPIEARSRLGRGIERKGRSDRGQRRTPQNAG